MKTETPELTHPELESFDPSNYRVGDKVIVRYRERQGYFYAPGVIDSVNGQIAVKLTRTDGAKEIHHFFAEGTKPDRLHWVYEAWTLHPYTEMDMRKCREYNGAYRIKAKVEYKEKKAADAKRRIEIVEEIADNVDFATTEKLEQALRVLITQG